MANTKAKFFCEFCDTEVPQQSIVCPKCGHFFASVRCPKCGFTGTQREFSNGCKACGYAFSGSTTQKSTSSTSKENTKLPPKAKYKTRKNALSEIKKHEANQKREDSLPLWIYIFSITILVVLLAVLLSKR